ncbi:hypothetical protein ACXVY1_002917, partial [Listeria monocytogenes]
LSNEVNFIVLLNPKYLFEPYACIVYHPAPFKSYPTFCAYLSVVLVLAESTFYAAVPQVPGFEV